MWLWVREERYVDVQIALVEWDMRWDIESLQVIEKPT
jgi:hypothetical protein